MAGNSYVFMWELMGKSSMKLMIFVGIGFISDKIYRFSIVKSIFFVGASCKIPPKTKSNDDILGLMGLCPGMMGLLARPLIDWLF